MADERLPRRRVETRGAAAIPLLERERDVALIEELLDRALAGEGGVLLVEGPAGIGKTELLTRVPDAAGERGMRALVARGGELERELPFAVVRELLTPAVERAARAERDVLMAGAARLAAAVLGSEVEDFESAGRPAPEGPRPGAAGLAEALHGLFWLCSNLADRSPLLLAIDDVHWADAASLRFVAYLAHRIGDLPAALVIGRRTGEPGADEDVIEAIRSEPVTSVLAPAPLSARAVADILRASYEEPVAEEFARACHGVTDGNPFLLRELLVAIRDQGLRPRAADAERVEAVRPHGVAVAVRARLARLPADAVGLARAMAVLGAAVELRDAAELAAIDEDAAERAADALVAAELIEAGRPLVFRHPLIRGAIYEDLPPRRRASAHARAARRLAEKGAASENVAAHLLHTEPARDDRVVQVLREAAAVSVSRGAPQQAVSYLRRALAEPPSGDLRKRVLHELGGAEIAAGDPDAHRHLSEALALSDVRDRAAVAEMLAVAFDAAGRHADVVAMLHDEIDRTRPVDPDAALRLEGALLSSEWLLGSRFVDVGDVIRRVAGLRGETPGERLLLAAAAAYAAFFGGTAGQALDLARRALAGDRLLDEHRVDAPPFWIATAALVAAERHDESLAHLDAAERAAARQGSAIGSALALGSRAVSAYLRGAIQDAAAVAADAMEQSLAAGWGGGHPYVVGTLALALVEQGDLAAADRVFFDQHLAGELPPQQAFDAILVARGTLRLAQRRPAEALEDLREVAARQAQRGMETPFFFYAWRPPAARSLAALGDRDGARRTAEEGMRMARRWGTPGWIASALRSLADVEEGDARIARLQEALTVLGDSEAGHERMHVMVELGAALRRERRVAESREPLLAGLELAERDGAQKLAERARAELAATGIRRRKRAGLTGVEALTPSERRTAVMAAGGMSNPEIAQSLFVSRRTVETHLTHAYAKLKISSRDELRAALAGDGPPPQ